MPLESKVRLSLMTIRAWYNHWEGDGVVVAIGEASPEESLTLRHLANEVCPDALSVMIPERSHRPLVPFSVGDDAILRDSWLLHGCNAFEAPFPTCRPLSFWFTEDLRGYVKAICSKRIDF